MTLSDLDDDTRRLLERYGFERDRFEALQRELVAGRMTQSRNLIREPLRAPDAKDLPRLPQPGDAERRRLHALGEQAIRDGKVGCVVLAGGMATRFGGVVKAGVEALPGRSFIDLKLSDIRHAAETARGRVPIFLMTSFATDQEVARAARTLSSDAAPAETFAQFISLRLREDGNLYRDARGRPSPYAPGHGDLSFALRRSGLLQRFLHEGGELLYMSNVDNLAATLDPAVIGAHLDGGVRLTAEVAPKLPGDAGGAPAWLDDKLQIIEAFRFPPEFDQDSIPVFNTNSFVIDARAIDRDFDLTWFVVRKKVDDVTVIQFERLVGQLTAHLDSQFLQVERDGSDGRFQPVKDPAELAQRVPEIRARLQARGIL